MTALTERAKKLGRTVSFVELLTRSRPLNVGQINDLVYNPKNYDVSHPLMAEYKVNNVYGAGLSHDMRSGTTQNPSMLTKPKAIYI